MTDANAAVFWSYAREDDELDAGRISGLVAKLRAEYSLISASPLEIFFDRESLEWGDAWQQRIEEAIAGTVFFIPIITPRFFTREACRAELLQFVAQARRVGLDRQFVLPVYYVTVAELEADTPPDDEAMAIVQAYQWEDLRQIRLVDQDSSAFRIAVNRLAESILERVGEIALTAEAALPVGLLGRDDRDDGTADDDSPGVLERLAGMEMTFPRASETLNDISALTEELTGLANEAVAELQEADAKGKGFAGRLRATERYAARLRDPANRLKTLGQSYAADMMAINAGVLTLLDELQAAGDTEGEEVQDFFSSIEAAGQSSREYVASLRETLAQARQLAKMSRSLRKPTSDIETGLRNVVDGQQIVEAWASREREIRGGSGA